MTSIRSRGLFVAGLCVAFCIASFSSHAAETLPGAVSDLIRELGELRDVCWGLMDEAKKAHTNDPTALAPLNAKYIEARAAANSLIEQLQLETVARTKMDVRRYERTVGRTRDLCRSLTNQWENLMFPPPAKTRGATATVPPPKPTVNLPSESIELAGKAVGLADGLLSMVAKNSKSFRDLDAQQRTEVQKLLEERKWKPLETSSAHRAPDPAPAASSTNSPVSK
jgi:hypothetical protein